MKSRRSSLILLAVFAWCAFVGPDLAAGQTGEVAKVSYQGKKDAPTETAGATDKPATIAVPAFRPNLSRVGIQTSTPISLSLDDAIRKALTSNNAIEITRDDVRKQETQIRSILGSYDPVITVSPTFTHNNTTGSSATRDFTINANMLQSIRPGGGNYQAFFNNTRTENAFSQAQVSSGSIGGSSNSAVYSSSTGIRYTQPLFRNFGIDNTRRNLKVARRVLEQTDADFRRQTIEIIAQVQRTYWDLVFALRDQQNRIANVNLAQESLRQIEARIDAGAAAPLARAEVATELATREGELLQATQQVSITENSLKQLLLRDATSPEWSQTYTPTDKPAFSLNPVNLDNAIKDAMDNRFELRRLKLARDINAVDMAYYKNQTKPQIDLNTTFSLDGLALGGARTSTALVPQFLGNDEILRTRLNNLLVAGGQSPIDNPNLEIPGTQPFLAGGFNRSLSNIFRSDAPNYSIGVTISFPLRNRTAKANLAGSQILENQIATQTRQQEEAVIVEVRNAVQAVETKRQQVLTSRRARENAEIQLAGEQQLLEAGKSTTFLLFQRENALTAARNSEIRAETDYNKALAELQRVTSTTLESNNITVETPKEDK